MLDLDEFGRWYAQAEHTLASARRDARDGDHGWACFKAQQGAEMGVKALLRALGKIAVGHSLLALTDRLQAEGIDPGDSIRRAARALDFHYIPTRYPDAFPAGAPFTHYDGSRSQQALEHAGMVLEWVQRTVEALRETGGLPDDKGGTGQ